MQQSIFAALGRHERRPEVFVDLFCGVGGASQGAKEAGMDVLFAVDSDADALAIHKTAHPHCVQWCVELPHEMLAPQMPPMPFWLHGSPPCTKVSKANQQRRADEQEEGLELVRWFVHFAMSSRAQVWSMEQAGTPIVLKVMQELREQHANRFDFDVFDLYEHGVPQHRRRLIAGSPRVVAGLKRLPPLHRCVRDVLDPRGTHIRNGVYKVNTKLLGVDPVTGRNLWHYEEHDADDYCVPVNGPSHTVLAHRCLTWAWPGTEYTLEVMTAREAACLQTFPPDYPLHPKKVQALRGVGNALPPAAARRMIEGAFA